MTDDNVTESPARIAGRSYVCESCGAQVEFAAGSGTLLCPYCSHEQVIVALPRQVQEHVYAELAQLPAAPMAVPDGLMVFTCPNCNAVTESDGLSVSCQFCAAPLVTDVSQTLRVVPEAVVPFGLDRDAARDALRKWTSSRWFAPSTLKKVSEAETFRGTYLPHWTYDADTSSDYRGERGEYYTVSENYTETVDGRTETRSREVRRTRWHNANGTVRRSFDDVLVPGTTQVSAKQLEKLAPWPLERATPYQEAYLAGFRTLRYDVEPEHGLETAKQLMAVTIEDDCREDIGGDEQQVHSVATEYSDITFKLLLLPVWFLTYLHGGKSLQVVVNAGTGEVTGERPYSAGKIIAAVVAVLLVVAVVVALTQH